MTGREKHLAVMTIGVAAATVLYVYVGEPFFSRWQNLRNDLVEARKTYESSANLLALRRRIDEAIQEELPEEEALGSVEEETASLFKKVEAHAAKAGLRIREMRPTTVRDREFGRESEIGLAGEGQAKSLASFLLRLEVDRSLIWAKRMEVTAGEKPGEVRVNLSLIRILHARGTWNNE